MLLCSLFAAFHVAWPPSDACVARVKSIKLCSVSFLSAFFLFSGHLLKVGCLPSFSYLYYTLTLSSLLVMSLLLVPCGRREACVAWELIKNCAASPFLPFLGKLFKVGFCPSLSCFYYALLLLFVCVASCFYCSSTS